MNAHYCNTSLYSPPRFPPPSPSEYGSIPATFMWLWAVEGGQRKDEKRAGGGMKEWKQRGSILLPEGDSSLAQKCLHSSFHECQQSTLEEERLIGEMDSIFLHWNNQDLLDPPGASCLLQATAGTPALLTHSSLFSTHMCHQHRFYFILGSTTHSFQIFIFSSPVEQCSTASPVDRLK